MFMNLTISPLMISRFIIIASIAIVIKIMMLVMLSYLPHSGVNSIETAEDSFYFKYRVAKALGLQKPKKVAPKHNGAIVTSNSDDANAQKMVFNGVLKAIYATKHNPFIVVAIKAKAQLLSIGEELQFHTLKEIHPNYALFVKNGVRYALRFKELDKKSSITLSTAPVEEITDIDAAVFVKRKEINYYAKNIKQIWKNIKIKEQIKNKRLQGFKVTWIKKGSIFDKLGLKKDDLITGVNNKKFKSISQVFRLYNNMQKMDNLKLSIMRGNEEKELEYEIL